METNPLLQALTANYGDGNPPPDDVSTVRGLLSFAKKWLSGDVGADQLHNPCLELAGRLKGGAQATERDLKANPHLDPGTKGPVQRMAVAYRRIAQILEELPQLAVDGDVEEYRDAIEEFEYERQAVLNAQDQVASTMDGTVLRCPRCQIEADGYDLCPAEPSCEMVTLYPDPKMLTNQPQRSADLTPIHASVYRSYLAVMKGDESLPHLIAALTPLEAHLDELSQTAQSLADLEAGEEEERDELEEGRAMALKLQRELESSHQGVLRIKEVMRTRQMRDLTRGWEELFDSGQTIRSLLRSFAKQRGYLEPEALESHDLIEFRGD